MQNASESKQASKEIALSISSFVFASYPALNLVYFTLISALRSQPGDAGRQNRTRKMLLSAPAQFTAQVCKPDMQDKKRSQPSDNSLLALSVSTLKICDSVLK